jgi:hypothetical protein
MNLKHLLILMSLPVFAVQAQRAQNVALKQLGTTVAVTQGAINSLYALEGVIDGDVSDGTAIRVMGTPAVLELTFAEEREVNCLRIYPGLLANSENASGACSLASYEVEGYVNNGWAPLATVENATAPKPGIEPKDYFFEHQFPSMYLSKLRLRILASADTGRRMAAPDRVTIPPSMRVTMLRELQVFESDPGKHAYRGRADYLSGDFRAAFYRNCTQARLDVIMDESVNSPRQANVNILSPDGKQILRGFPFELKTGINRLSLNIAGLADGRYPVNVEIETGNVTECMTRLLRIDNGVVTKVRHDVCDVSGKCVYLFDDYHVETRQQLNSQVNGATPHLAAWIKLAPGKSHWLNKRGKLGLTQTGSLTIPYQDWDVDGYRWRHALCRDPLTRPDQWEVHDGKGPESIRTASFPAPSPKARGRWQLKTSLDKASFRWYDPARDGVPPLREIKVLHTGTKRRQFGDLEIPYRSTFAVWEKTAGEILFLSKKPLVTDTILPGGDLLEKEDATSDNFGGQYLSEDGQTLYYMVGRVVKRFPPYVVGYDNQRYSNRLLTAYHTRDGFHWNKQFILPVTEDEPWSLQQYGTRIFKDPNADLYWGFLSSYHCQRQQMYIDIITSRDLLNWTRPGPGTFIACSDIPDHWRFGLILPAPTELRVGDQQILFVQNVLSWPHFYHELRDCHTPESICRRYQRRGFELGWPYFSKVGGYKGLMRSKELAYTRRPLGVAIARPNGYVSVSAAGKAGTLLTRPFRASGSLSLNADTGPDGWIKLRLKGLDGQPLAGFDTIWRGNELDAELFTSLPSKPFKINIIMKNARFFSLKFNQ